MKAMVSLSGGLDSSTCLGLMVEELGACNVEAVSVYYGQRHSREAEGAESVAAHYGVGLHMLDLSGSGVFDGSGCSLLGAGEIPEGSYSEQLANGRISTLVPFRNGLLVSAMAAKALSLDAGSEWKIVLGAHADDAAGDAYPDCSVEFVAAMDRAVRLGTGGTVGVVAPFVGETKAGVVREGLRLGVPYGLTWSCYKGGELACGRCGTCIDRLRAFAANGADDPIEYEE